MMVLPRRDRRGIALPMVLLVLLALGLISSLALSDAIQAYRASGLAGDALQARSAAHRALPLAFNPPDLALLCLQPPHAEMVREVTFADGTEARISWRALTSRVHQLEVTGHGIKGARVRLLGRLTPDSLPSEPWVFGCPAATRLQPAGPDWWFRHPAG
jgi:hypothetical protein